MSPKRKVRKPKYKVGDMVYSYQNPTTKRPIDSVRPPDPRVPSDTYAYRLALPRGSSKWLQETSLRMRKRKLI